MYYYGASRVLNLLTVCLEILQMMLIDATVKLYSNCRVDKSFAGLSSILNL